MDEWNGSRDGCGGSAPLWRALGRLLGCGSPEDSGPTCLTLELDAHFFHLGGTNCAGTPAEGFACQYANLGRIELSSSGLGPIVIDASSLYRELDLTERPDGAADLVPGCMASSGDPECPAMFEALGLSFEGEPRKAPRQVAFELP